MTVLTGIAGLVVLVLIQYVAFASPFIGLAALLCVAARGLPERRRRLAQVITISLLCTPLLMPGGIGVTALPSGFVLPALLINRWHDILAMAGHRERLAAAVPYLEVWVPAFALVAVLANLILRKRSARTTPGAGMRGGADAVQAPGDVGRR
jgi:hypothetical protein